MSFLNCLIKYNNKIEEKDLKTAIDYFYKVIKENEFRLFFISLKDFDYNIKYYEKFINTPLKIDLSFKSYSWIKIFIIKKFFKDIYFLTDSIAFSHCKNLGYNKKLSLKIAKKIAELATFKHSTRIKPLYLINKKISSLDIKDLIKN